MEATSKQPKRVPHLPWMRNPVDIDQLEERPLSILPCLDPRLEEALKKMGIQSLFPVQVAVWQETIGPGAFERDICVNSPTGSGKTLAYALPIVQALSMRKIRCLRALVVLPTRDLALQVKDVFSAIAPAVGIHVGLAIGQSSIEDEILELIKRPKLGMCSPFDPEDPPMDLQTAVDILVATPGRLMDHINMTKGFSLEHLCYLVVDETDRLLREAYQSWLPTVIQLTQSDYQPGHARSIPGTPDSLTTTRRCGVERGFKGKIYPRLVKMILSATLTQDPSKISQLDLHHPLLLTSGDKRYKLPKRLESFKLICRPKLKPVYLVALLQSLKGEKSIVFTSSVESTHRLSTLLKLFGELPIKISEYSRRQHQSIRSKKLKAFKEGKTQVLIATDAMTRGMDVEGIINVINYDMPAFVKTYIHRAGRTARAGQSGRCFTLLRKHEVKQFNKMLEKAGNISCDFHSLPTDSIESLRPLYSFALEKLKEREESKIQKKSSISFRSASQVREKSAVVKE
ncbi:DEAD-box ATP-dependent RNA helicase 1 [Canna indica]|uniref:ATP-dependent RNA helicase n=1 Tax=Canna indica TaxID=4628 RepID=A0AAQ3QFW3_9LILI|nr:DEAD-box ATP-dependent RNA helicase 1 [Canna indica]